MSFLDSPLRPQHDTSWALQIGAIALWCGMAALLLLGLAYVLPHPWYEIGCFSFPPAVVAPLLGLVALGVAPRLQKVLGLGAVVLGSLFFVALRLS